MATGLELHGSALAFGSIFESYLVSGSLSKYSPNCRAVLYSSGQKRFFRFQVAAWVTEKP